MCNIYWAISQTMIMGRKSNTDLRRQQIIEALLVEMTSAGFDRASTKSIAERAGLSPGLVHYHFKNKEEILLVLVDQLMALADLRLEYLSKDKTRASERIEAFVTARLGIGSKHDNEQARAWVNIIAEAMGQSAVRQRVARWLAVSRGDLRRWFKEAGASDPDEHTAILMAMVLGSFSLQALQPNAAPSGYAERQALHWLRSVLPAVSKSGR